MGQRASRSGGGCLRAKPNGKWISKLYLKISNIVEDASEPAPFLSVAAGLNGKWTRVFALIERPSFEKNSEHQNHKIVRHETREAGGERKERLETTERKQEKGELVG